MTEDAATPAYVFSVSFFRFIAPSSTQSRRLRGRSLVAAGQPVAEGDQAVDRKPERDPEQHPDRVAVDHRSRGSPRSDHYRDFAGQREDERGDGGDVSPQATARKLEGDDHSVKMKNGPADPYQRHGGPARRTPSRRRFVVAHPWISVDGCPDECSPAAIPRAIAKSRTQACGRPADRSQRGRRAHAGSEAWAYRKFTFSLHRRRGGRIVAGSCGRSRR